MKQSFSQTLLSLLFCALSLNVQAAEKPTYRLSLDLLDGSRVTGTAAIQSFPVKTDYGKVVIPLDGIDWISRKGESNTATLALLNGDRFTASLTVDQFSLATIFGKVTIDTKHVTRILVLSGPDAVMPRMEMEYFGTRLGRAKEAAIEMYAGTREGEEAVIRALRWLRDTQLVDGSWPGHANGAGPGKHAAARAAYTGMALLAFLGHGECPLSVEFGTTVKKAIQFLLNDQDGSGRFRSSDRAGYAHPIASLALCEAYGLTSDEKIRAAAQKAMSLIIKGQNASGGWDYNMRQSQRNDLSYMGWCAQAVRAAHDAGVMASREQITCAMKNAVHGFKKNADLHGGFGYTSPGRSALTGVGVASMWLMGGGNDAQRRKGTAFLAKSVKPTWHVTRDDIVARSPVYYWYYINQAMFHEGGALWTKWNKGFLSALTKEQKIIEDSGYWQSPSESEHTGGNVQDTALCALMLEVYYRTAPARFFKK